MTDTIADFTTTISNEPTVAHRLLDLLADWQEVYKVTGYGEFEIKSIAWLLGLM